MNQNGISRVHKPNTEPVISDFLIFTEPSENIFRERVDFFKNEISKGKRPSAIVLTTEVYSNHIDTEGNNSQIDFQTEKFVLDGHHKLIAYKELNISPNIILITKKEIAKRDTFEITELEKYLFKYQKEHIEKHIRINKTLHNNG